MIKVVTAPCDVYDIESMIAPKLFLAGGITNCPDWQSDVIKRMKSNFTEELNLVIYNPRRKKFDIKKKNETEKQIAWEFDKLQNSDYICFWFAKGSINPIVLYELGMWGNSRPEKKIIVGVDPDYERINDVILQTKLARPTIQVQDDFNSFVRNICHFF